MKWIGIIILAIIIELAVINADERKDDEDNNDLKLT